MTTSEKLRVNPGYPDRRIVRLLSGIETRMAVFHEYLNGSTQGTQILEVSLQCSFAMFRQAAQYLHRCYASLQCSIVKNKNQYEFWSGVPFDEIPCLHFTAESSAVEEAFIQKLVDDPIPQDQYLWRVAFIQREEKKAKIIIGIHHAIIDGVGNFAIAKTLLESLDTLIAGKSLQFNKIISIPASIEGRLKSNRVSTSVRPSIPPVAYQTQAPLESRHTRWITQRIRKEDFLKLQQKTQQDKIKTHALYSAAMCCALTECGLQASPVDFGSTLSLRFLIGSNDSDFQNPLGCCMTIAKIVVDTTESFLARIASKLNAELMKEFMTSCTYSLDIDVETLVNAADKLRDARCFTQGAGITNVGLVDIPSEFEHIKLENYCTLANRVAGNLSIVVHCYEFNAEQFLVFVYPEPLLSNSTVRQVSEKMMSLLCGYMQDEK